VDGHQQQGKRLAEEEVSTPQVEERHPEVPLEAKSETKWGHNSRVPIFSDF